MPAFKIPRQTDRALLRALVHIRDDLKEFGVPLGIRVQTFEIGGTNLELPDQNPEAAPPIQPILSEESEIMPRLELRGGNQIALHIQRQFTNITDDVNVAHDQHWINQVREELRLTVLARLISSARKHLRAADTEAVLHGGTDNEWARYRDSQQVILNSLSEAQLTVITTFSEKALALEGAMQSKLDQRQTDLEAKYKALELQLSHDHEVKVATIEKREATIEEREKKFNTKEARYVARNEQQAQIEQIKGWLEDWSLTKGTRSKRYIVVFAYVAGALVTGVLAGWFSYQSAQIFQSAGPEISKIEWWQWALLSLKAILPLAAFITFIIYFIRWSSEWARQHAEEEFRNRARILDIGRSAWLLEAVRDAQDSQKEIPVALLTELSRNLFSYVSLHDSSDLHPQAITDLIMQGLSSIRVKTSTEGTEVEATRRRKRLFG